MKKLRITKAMRNAIESGEGVEISIVSSGVTVTFICYKHENAYAVSANGMLLSTHKTLRTAIEKLRQRYNDHAQR